MSPVGYFYSGEQFAEQPASWALMDEGGEGVVRVPDAVGAATRQAVAIAVAFVVGLGAGGDVLAAQTGAAAAEGGVSVPIVHESLDLHLAISGDVLPFTAAPSAVEAEYDGLVFSVERPGAPLDAFAAPDVLPNGTEIEDETGFTPLPVVLDGPWIEPFVDTPVLPIEPATLPMGADETGWLPPIPPPPGPTFGVFEATDELVEQPTPAVGEYGHRQTLVHEERTIEFFQSGESLPGGTPPPSIAGESIDIMLFVDPTVVEDVPTIIFFDGDTSHPLVEEYGLPETAVLVVPETVFWDAFTDQEGLPGAVAPSIEVREPDIPVLALPQAEPTWTEPFVDQEALPGAVAPTQVEDAVDGLLPAPPSEQLWTQPFTDDETLPGAAAPTIVADEDQPVLAGPVSESTWTEPFVDQDVLPQPPAPLGIHDEAGPADLVMFSLPEPPFTASVGADAPWPAGITVLYPLPYQTGRALFEPMIGPAEGERMVGPATRSPILGPPE